MNRIPANARININRILSIGSLSFFTRNWIEAAGTPRLAPENSTNSEAEPKDRAMQLK
ncbi:hypothetical protein Thiowin_05110 [Thiorhodovibrio winogradskyi]|uniref:Uncharacterized protein n=1 Tax=Thiorhodovibrio winogradskyi TaxID=77007 RepID=A0ABZ0SFY3_9GAMM